MLTNISRTRNTGNTANINGNSVTGDTANCSGYKKHDASTKLCQIGASISGFSDPNAAVITNVTTIARSNSRTELTTSTCTSGTIVCTISNVANASTNTSDGKNSYISCSSSSTNSANSDISISANKVADISNDSSTTYRHIPTVAAPTRKAQLRERFQSAASTAVNTERITVSEVGTQTQADFPMVILPRQLFDHFKRSLLLDPNTSVYARNFDSENKNSILILPDIEHTSDTPASSPTTIDNASGPEKHNLSPEQSTLPLMPVTIYDTAYSPVSDADLTDESVLDLATANKDPDDSAPVIEIDDDEDDEDDDLNNNTIDYNIAINAASIFSAQNKLRLLCSKATETESNELINCRCSKLRRDFEQLFKVKLDDFFASIRVPEQTVDRTDNVINTMQSLQLSKPNEITPPLRTCNASIQSRRCSIDHANKPCTSPNDKYHNALQVPESSTQEETTCSKQIAHRKRMAQLAKSHMAKKNQRKQQQESQNHQEIKSQQTEYVPSHPQLKEQYQEKGILYQQLQFQQIQNFDQNSPLFQQPDQYPLQSQHQQLHQDSLHNYQPHRYLSQTAQQPIYQSHLRQPTTVPPTKSRQKQPSSRQKQPSSLQSQLPRIKTRLLPFVSEQPQQQSPTTTQTQGLQIVPYPQQLSTLQMLLRPPQKQQQCLEDEEFVQQLYGQKPSKSYANCRWSKRGR